MRKLKKVIVRHKYTDIELNEQKKVGDTMILDPSRAEYLARKGLVSILGDVTNKVATLPKQVDEEPEEVEKTIEEKIENEVAEIKAEVKKKPKKRKGKKKKK